MLKQVGFLNFIKKDWLDATVSFYLQHQNLSKVKNELNELIEPECPKNEVRRKTIDVLTKTWIRIPNNLKTLQRQGLEFYDEITPRERLSLHWGMLLANYPFFHDVIGHIGSLLQIQDKMTNNQIRKRMVENWGQRTTLIRAIDRVIQSMRDWNVLLQTNSSFSARSSLSIKNHNLCLWLLETALRAEKTDSLLFDKLVSLPTIFPFKLEVPFYEIKRASNFEHHIHGLNFEVISLKTK